MTSLSGSDHCLCSDEDDDFRVIAIEPELPVARPVIVRSLNMRRPKVCVGTIRSLSSSSDEEGFKSEPEYVAVPPRIPSQIKPSVSGSSDEDGCRMGRVSEYESSSECLYLPAHGVTSENGHI